MQNIESNTMKPEEHMIDSLLHEHKRVQGENDETFLQELEERLDRQTAPDIIPIEAPAHRSQGIKPLPVWAAIAAVACITAAISINLYFNKEKGLAPVASNDKAAKQLQQPKGNLAEHIPLATKANGIEKEIPSRKITENTNKRAIKAIPTRPEAAQLDMETVAGAMVGPTNQTKPNSHDYKTLLVKSMSILRHQHNAPLPEAVKQFSDAKLAEFKLALNLLEYESSKSLKQKQDEEQAKNTFTDKITALHTFNEVFKRTPQHRSQSKLKIPNTAPPSANAADVKSAIRGWRKELEN